MSSKIPSPTVLAHAAKLAIAEDRPIYLDYYNDSLEKKCCIGVREEDKCLIKSNTEYTSSIVSITRLKEEGVFIVLTENSLYIVSSDIPIKRIVTPSTETSS
jgi:hypothetical protein